MTWIFTTIVIMIALIGSLTFIVRSAKPSPDVHPQGRIQHFTLLVVALLVVLIPAISAALYFGCQAGETFR